MRLRQPIRLRTFRAACGALFMLAALAAPALAGGTDPPGYGVPEIDPGSMLSAMTLMAGGVLMVTDRCRRRK
ncbi:MAG: hypothetical protein ABI353_21180 [Isosphaeraceae bacterium]